MEPIADDSIHKRILQISDRLGLNFQSAFKILEESGFINDAIEARKFEERKRKQREATQRYRERAARSE